MPSRKCSLVSFWRGEYCLLEESLMYRKEFMAMANEEAKANVNGSDGGPFGCVIIKDGKVVSRAHNHVLVDHDPTAHGEITAIRKAGQALGTMT